jgi:hypothetical protein
VHGQQSVVSTVTELAAIRSAGLALSVSKPIDKHFINTSTIISFGLGTVEYAACLQDKPAGNKTSAVSNENTLYLFQ